VARRGRHRPTSAIGPRGLLSGPYNGSAMLRPLTDTAKETGPLGVVLADAEFDSEHNHRHVRKRLGAVSVIPAKRGKATWQLQGYRAEMRTSFPSQLYRRRALVERVCFQRSSVSCRHERRAGALKRSGHKRFSWVWLTTCTGSDSVYLKYRICHGRGCQQSQIASRNLTAPFIVAAPGCGSRSGRKTALMFPRYPAQHHRNLLSEVSTNLSSGGVSVA
jgi:hypothetical protein